MQKHGIRYFFYVGGNDSSDTVQIVNRHAEEAGYDFRAIHIPKTIDNDLLLNDHCPGFGSAARFVTQAFIGLNLDNRALSGVLIGVVMGRHAGFLTASSSLARKYVDEGPHLIYLPERPFSTDRFLAAVDRVYKQHGLCTVAVSEGVQDEHGTPIAQTLSGSVGTGCARQRSTLRNRNCRRPAGRSGKNKTKDQAGPCRYFRLLAKIIPRGLLRPGRT